MMTKDKRILTKLLLKMLPGRSKEKIEEIGKLFFQTTPEDIGGLTDENVGQLVRIGKQEAKESTTQSMKKAHLYVVDTLEWELLNDNLNPAKKFIMGRNYVKLVREDYIPNVKSKEFKELIDEILEWNKQIPKEQMLMFYASTMLRTILMTGL